MYQLIRLKLACSRFPHKASWLTAPDGLMPQAVNTRIELESYVYRLRVGFTRDGRATFRQIVFADEEVRNAVLVLSYKPCACAASKAIQALLQTLKLLGSRGSMALEADYQM